MAMGGRGIAAYDDETREGTSNLSKRWRVSLVVGIPVLAALGIFAFGRPAWSDTRDEQDVAGVGRRSPPSRVEPTRDADARQPAGASEERRRRPPTKPRLTGHLVALDEHGRQYPQESGSLRIWSRATRSELAVPVTDGAWSLVVPADESELRPRGGEASGRPFACDEGASLPLTGSATVRGHWLHAVRLRVLGGDAESDLGGIEVRCPGTGRAAVSPTPDRGTVVLTDGASPVELPAPNPARHVTETYWVRAIGHCWQTVQIDHSRPGERRLRLPAGGALAVTLQGDALGREEIMVRVRRDGAGVRPIAETRLVADGITRLEGVPAGAARVCIEAGGWHGPRLFGEAEVRVRAGDVTNVTVRIAGVERASLTLRGQLVLPAAWPRQDVVLTVLPIGELVAVSKQKRRVELAAMKQLSAETYGFEIDGLRPDVYQAIVTPLEARLRVELVRGAPPVRIEVPPPADVRVRLLDAATGQRIFPGRVSWRTALPEGVRGYSVRLASLDEANREFALRAPFGEVFLRCEAAGYTSVARTYEAGPNENRWTVNLARSCGVRIRLITAGAAVPWDSRKHHATLRQVGGSGRSAGQRYADGRVDVRVTQPGTYELVLHPIDGFMEVAERSVRIGQGEWKDITIQLRRAR